MGRAGEPNPRGARVSLARYSRKYSSVPTARLPHRSLAHSRAVRVSNADREGGRVDVLDGMDRMADLRGCDNDRGWAFRIRRLSAGSFDA